MKYFFSFTSTAASFSSASVPSAALVLLLMVLTAIDIPDQDVFLLFAVDWLVYEFFYLKLVKLIGFYSSDRFRTTNNMLGDCYAAAVVEKLSKKELMACDAILSQVIFYKSLGFWYIYFFRSWDLKIIIVIWQLKIWDLRKS